VTVGLTDFAQNQLRDIVYVELPAVGASFKKETAWGHRVRENGGGRLFPVTGSVTEINEALKDSPQWVNEDPYGKVG